MKVTLKDSNAGKSLVLFKMIRERDLTDKEVMTELGAASGAYYALRSRLIHRIEEYLIQQAESPRTDLMRKVTNINDVLFTQPRSLAIGTLKKLERELIDYDLSNELTLVYKSLKKLHVNHPNYFHYSQLYNRHVAYMLAMDKAEELLGDYFKKYGDYLLTGNASIKTGLSMVAREMHNVCNLYQSHRLYVFNSCISIFHRLFVESEDEGAGDYEVEPIEDMLRKNLETLNVYSTDKIYHYMHLVFDYLRWCYYDHFQVHRKAESYYDELNGYSPLLLSNYNLYTFPANFLIKKLQRALRKKRETLLYEENEDIYSELELDNHDMPQKFIYMSYRALSCFYVDKIEETTKWMNDIIAAVNWKKYPVAILDAKIMLMMLYEMKSEKTLVKQLSTSVQRQIRMVGKDFCALSFSFYRMLKIPLVSNKRDKLEKMMEAAVEMERMRPSYFSPLTLIRLDENLMATLIEANEPTKV